MLGFNGEAGRELPSRSYEKVLSRAESGCSTKIEMMKKEEKMCMLLKSKR